MDLWKAKRSFRRKTRSLWNHLVDWLWRNKKKQNRSVKGSKCAEFSIITNKSELLSQTSGTISSTAYARKKHAESPLPYREEDDSTALEETISNADISSILFFEASDNSTNRSTPDKITSPMTIRHHSEKIEFDPLVLSPKRSNSSEITRNRIEPPMKDINADDLHSVSTLTFLQKEDNFSFASTTGSSLRTRMSPSQIHNRKVRKKYNRDNIEHHLQLLSSFGEEED